MSYFTEVGKQLFDPLTWLGALPVAGLCLLALYPLLGVVPGPQWMTRVATRVFDGEGIDRTDGWVLWGYTAGMGVAAGTVFGPNPETALTAGALVIGVYGLVIFHHLGRTERRLAVAEAELKALKESRCEDAAASA